MELVAALDLIGEIDRIDIVAEAVAAVMGPAGEATIYAPIGSTPLPGAATPSSPSSTVPPLFGVTASRPTGAPMTTTPPVNVTPARRTTPCWRDAASAWRPAGCRRRPVCRDSA